MHFKPGDIDDLAQRIQRAITHSAELRQMGENAREEYERRYTPETNYHMLMDIYQQAIEAASHRQDSRWARV